jgi:hypothetical protein
VGTWAVVLALDQVQNHDLDIVVLIKPEPWLLHNSQTLVDHPNIQPFRVVYLFQNGVLGLSGILSTSDRSVII